MVMFDMWQDIALSCQTAAKVPVKVDDLDIAGENSVLSINVDRPTKWTISQAAQGSIDQVDYSDQKVRAWLFV